MFQLQLTSILYEHSRIVLLLTKLDLFKEKIQHTSIKKYRPDYTGQDDDWEAAKDFLVDKFVSLDECKDRDIRVFCTNATDKDDIGPILRTIMPPFLDFPQQDPN